MNECVCYYLQLSLTKQKLIYHMFHWWGENHFVASNSQVLLFKFNNSISLPNFEFQLSINKRVLLMYIIWHSSTFKDRVALQNLLSFYLLFSIWMRMWIGGSIFGQFSSSFFLFLSSGDNMERRPVSTWTWNFINSNWFWWGVCFSVLGSWTLGEISLALGRNLWMNLSPDCILIF